MVSPSPSSSARGTPVCGSCTSTTAETLGSPFATLRGLTLPNLHTGPVLSSILAA
jgi:hypothetical protein